MKTTIFALFLSLLIICDSNIAQTNQPNQIFEKQTNLKTTSSNELSVGTIVLVQTESEISSSNSSVNDTFTTILSEPVVLNGIIILPVKTIIQGKITKVEKSARGGKAGILEIMFDRIKFLDGTSRDLKGELVDISGTPEQLRGKSSTLVNVALIGGGTGLGTAIGATAGGNNKIAIGGLLGAGIGISSIFLRKGDEATLKANSKLSIKITETLVLPVKDY
jgi:hypothetical protein